MPNRPKIVAVVDDDPNMLRATGDLWTHGNPPVLSRPLRMPRAMKQRELGAAIVPERDSSSVNRLVR
jgi:hypothetical protein